MWTLHVQSIHKKAPKRLNNLRMLKYKVKRKPLVKIYFAFIRRVMEYSDVVWNNGTEKDSKMLEDVQVEAGRIITDVMTPVFLYEMFSFVRNGLLYEMT